MVFRGVDHLQSASVDLEVNLTFWISNSITGEVAVTRPHRLISEERIPTKDHHEAGGPLFLNTGPGGI